MKKRRSFETSGTTRPMAQRHIAYVTDVLTHTVGSTAPSLKHPRFFFKWLNVEDGTDVLS
jgi:hypothetical protein